MNNAAAHVDAGVPCHRASAAAFDRMVAINLRAPFLFARGCLRAAFVPQRAGVIVNVGSVHAYQSAPGLAAYSACKGGVAALTRQLAVEYAPHVRVNCVVPGTINTPMNRGFMEEADERSDRSPFGRWGTPDEVPQDELFLASAAASYVSRESACDGACSPRRVGRQRGPGLAEAR